MLASLVISSNQFYTVFGNLEISVLFYNGTERSDAIIRFIIQDVKARINIDFFRFSLDSFKNAWESPLCAIISDLPVVKFL